MRSARESATRLLQLMMIAAVVLPAALFVYAAWISYRQFHDVADERIGRSLDVMQEQALKVFETINSTFAEVNEIVRGMSDAQMRAEAPQLHERLAAIVATMPQLKAIVIVGRDGTPLVRSLSPIVPDGVNFSDRDYFEAQQSGDAGTYVSSMRLPQLPGGGGGEFFDLSRRLKSPDGSFAGVIAIAVRPGYFEDFYELIGRNLGSFFALVRSDGSYLARYPAPDDRSQRLSENSMLRTAIDRGINQGFYTVHSEIDGVVRRINFRKVPSFSVYALAGVSDDAIRAEWLSSMTTHLMYGLPAVILILAVLFLTLRRTQRPYEEADRREAAEIALRQSQRLEAIGQLTGGVAHDFNNLLMIVSGSVHRLRRDVIDEKQLRLLDAIVNAIRRGESLTRQLLSFSRRQTLQPTVIDLAAWLPELKEMLSRSLRGDIEVRLLVPRRPCFVKIDASELELALLNLAFNARDAMPSGGVLSITAKQSGGAANITSTPRRGTAITLFLPRSFEAHAQPSVLPKVAGAVLPGGPVLLVEDNADVIEVARGYFADLGFNAKVAASTQEGLALVEQDDGIALVFSDILMPGGLNGLDLAKELRRRFPSVAVLLTTGYSSSAQDAVREGFEVLQKPYDLAALERALLSVFKRHDRATAARQASPAPQRAAG
jgi:two-component system, NtrC family, sensor kinase